MSTEARCAWPFELYWLFRLETCVSFFYSLAAPVRSGRIGTVEEIVAGVSMPFDECDKETLEGVRQSNLKRYNKDVEGFGG